MPTTWLASGRWIRVRCFALAADAVAAGSAITIKPVKTIAPNSRRVVMGTSIRPPPAPGTVATP